MYYFTVQEIKSAKSKCEQDHTPSETSKSILPGLVLAPSGVLVTISTPCLQMSNSSLSFHVVFSLWVFTSFVNVCLCAQNSPSDTDISQIE